MDEIKPALTTWEYKTREDLNREIWELMEQDYWAKIKV